MTRKQQRLGWSILVSLVLSSWWIAPSIGAIAASQPGSPKASSLSTPTLQPPHPLQPTKVRVGFILIDFVGINQIAQSYTMQGYLLLQWQDKRLAFQPQKGEKIRRFDKEEIWSPSLHIWNAQDFKLIHESPLKVDPDGNVSYSQRFQATLSSPMNLQNFPFDQQNLKLIIYPEDGVEEIKLMVDRPSTYFEQQAFLPEWSLRNLQSKVTGVQPPFDHTYSIAMFTIVIDREPGFYIWKAFLPLLLITVLAWLSFWMPSVAVGPGPLSVSVGALLTSTTFIFTILNALPRVTYLTFFDGFFLLCYILIFASNIVHIFIFYLLHQKKDETALQVRRFFQWSPPLIFGLGSACLVLAFVL